MKVIAGYYKWVEREIEVDDKYTPLDIDDINCRTLTDEEDNLLEEMKTNIEKAITKIEGKNETNFNHRVDGEYWNIYSTTKANRCIYEMW